jgi:3-methyl-2-oxobutanoate hydroxymethyltransferase
MSDETSKRFTLADFRKSAEAGEKLAMLTCYDFSTARVLTAAGVKLLLAGDSAASVILGHQTTLPVPLDFMIEITAAVRRGAPDALVFSDMPFGSFGTTAEGVRNTLKMVKLSGCDCVKIECSRGHIGLVQTLSDAGVAVFAHLGMTPQSVKLEGYKARGRTARDVLRLVDLAADFVNAGAAGLLLEATTPPVGEMIANSLAVPIIGCGAGPACHAHVVVLHDLLSLTEKSPRFAPRLGDIAPVISKAASRFVQDCETEKYPKAAHIYEMPEDEQQLLNDEIAKWGRSTEDEEQ